MALLEQYGEGDVTRAIVDILNSSWPDCLKRHILIKELLWNKDYPRGVYGSTKAEPPHFSENAKSIWLSNVAKGEKRLRRGLVLEHVIPRNEIYALLISLPIVSYAAVRAIQETHMVRIFVTKEEDRTLDKNGLRSKMPDNWNTGGKIDIWARYAIAGITVSNWLPEAYQDNLDEEGEQA